MYGAGRLAQFGLRVLFADWELAGGDHRDRLERLFGASMPCIDYLRCDKPLIDEVDRIRRCVERQSSDFVIYDSIAPATGGPPEAAEHATAYWWAVRQIGLGGLHLAHINKSENGDQKPFGSSFWHNLARSTWFVKHSGTSPDGSKVTVGLFNRKANLTRLYPAVGFQFDFTADRTIVTRANLADIEDLAGQLPLWQRVSHVLKAGPLTIPEIAEQLDAKPDSIKKAVSPKRGKSMFTQVPSTDGTVRIALVARRVI